MLLHLAKHQQKGDIMLFLHNIAPDDEHINQIKELVKKWNKKIPYYLQIKFKINGNGSQVHNFVGRVEKKIHIEKNDFLTIVLIQDRLVENQKISEEKHEKTISIKYIEHFWPTSKEAAEQRIQKTTNLRL